MSGPVIDWDALRAQALAVMENAHAPFSGYRVGAAGLVDDGRVVVGCNVENASYGVTLCAECGMVSSLHATGGGSLVAMYCVNLHGDPITPCGRCRQVLLDHGGAEMQIATDEGVLTLGQLFPKP